jgi:hypothetical protein
MKIHAVGFVLRLRIDLEAFIQVFLRARKVSLGNKNIREVGEPTDPVLPSIWSGV